MADDYSQFTPVAPASSSITPEEYFSQVKSLYPNAVYNGGGRTPQRNAAVGGVPDSMHLTDQAMDFNVPGVPSSQVFATLRSAGLPMTETLNEGQVGSQGAHLHVGWAPKGGALAASDYSAFKPAPQPAAANPYAGFTPVAADPYAGFTPVNSTPPAAPKGNWATDLTGGVSADGKPNFIQQGIMDLSNTPFIKGVAGAYKEGVTGGLFMQPVRAAMEGMGYGMSQLKAAHPGQSDEWYNNTLHGIYSQAVTQARTQAQQQTAQNPYPGHQVGNFIAGAAASPENLLLGGGGTGATIGMRLATAAGANSVLSAASDAAAQGMDLLEGQKKKFDVDESLRAAQTGAVLGGVMHGAIEATPYVKGLFANRNVDTLPADDPRGSLITPLSQDHLALNAADDMKYRQLLQTGSVDDIKQFFNGRNGPHPSYQDVNTWIQHRDNATGPVMNEIQPNFDYEGEYNRVSELANNEQHRQAVETHISNQTAGWKNAPDVEVIHGPDDISDPAIRQQVQAQDDGTALGLFGADGKVRIFSGRVGSEAEANSVLYHEGLGHYGLQQQFGDKLDSTMNTLDQRNVGQFRKEVDARQAANPGESRTLSAEEVLATKSQAGQLKPAWQDALSATVRQFGRKMGLDIGYNDTDIQAILAMAHKSVVDGMGRDVAGNGFKTGSAPLDPATNKYMFAGSKATDGPHEIDDSGAKLTGTPMGTLGATLDHPELYKQYPHLQDTKVIHTPMEGDITGAYSPKTGRMYLNTLDKNPMSTVLHETQHAIQHYEGAMGPNDGTAHLNDAEYAANPLEREARAVEERKDFSATQRHEIPPKFMTRDDLGREQTDPALLDHIDQLKQDPRFWSDPEFRANVIEMARTREPGDYGPARTSFDGKFMKRSDLAASKDYVSDDLERIYHSLDENYKPTTMSWDETRRAAQELGFKPSQIRDLGETKQGELATRLWRMQSAANMADAKLTAYHEKLNSPDWSVHDQQGYLQTLADFNYLNARVRGDKAEYARALNVSKAAASYTNTTMAEVAERLKAAGSGLGDIATDQVKFMNFANSVKDLLSQGNKAGAHNLMAGIDKPYWEQYLTTLWHNSMLSSLHTHFKSTVDMINGIGLQAQENILSWPIDKLRSVFGKSAGTTANEAFAYSYGALRQVGNMEIYRAGLHAARTGEGSYVTPTGERTLTNQNTFGTIRNPRIGGGPGNVLGLLNKSTDLIAGQDTIMRSWAVGASIYKQAAQMAAEELGKGAKFDDINSLMTSYAHSPTEEMIRQANKDADFDLLMNNNKLNTLVDKGRVYTQGMSVNDRIKTFMLNTITPFIRVESNNLWSRFVMRSPLAVLDQGTREAIMSGIGKDATRAEIQNANMAITRVAYGTMKMALYWSSAAAGKNLLTDHGPKNVDKYKELQASGWSPDAVHQDGRFESSQGLNTSLNPFDMHNNTASMVAEMRQQWDAATSQDKVSMASKIGIGLKLAMGSLFHDMAKQSWVNDIAPAVTAATTDDGTAGQKTAKVLTNEVTNFYPAALTQTAQLMDPNRHDLNAYDAEGNADDIGTAMNTIQSRIPGLSKGLPIKYDVYGDPIQNGASLTGVRTPLTFIGIHGNNTQETTDPAKLEMERLSSLMKSALITPVQRNINLDNGTKMVLTPAQFEQYQHITGINIVSQVRQAMSDPSWQQMSDNDKAYAVRDIETQVKKDAREQLYGQPGQ